MFMLNSAEGKSAQWGSLWIVTLKGSNRFTRLFTKPQEATISFDFNC